MISFLDIEFIVQNNDGTYTIKFKDGFKRLATANEAIQLAEALKTEEQKQDAFADKVYKTTGQQLNA